MGERKLATLEPVQEIRPIEGADRIEVARIRNWEVVVGKGEFHEGDFVVYFEIDSALPLEHPAFSFLAERGSRIFGGKPVHVLKTAKLRGVYSQGLIVDPSKFPELEGHIDIFDKSTHDYTEILGIEKYEPPIPMDMKAEGAFPSFLQKTDAERVQNIDTKTWAEIQEHHSEWVPTEKVDGSSVTAWRTSDGKVHVAGRNWELSTEFENAHVQVAKDLPLEMGEWAQGEVAGPGIQGNPLDLTKVMLFVFGFGYFDAGNPSVATTTKAPRPQWPTWVKAISAPVYVDTALPVSIEDTIKQTEKLKSLISPGKDAEGIVWTHINGQNFGGLGNRAVFKSLSQKYLLKQDR